MLRPPSLCETDDDSDDDGEGIVPSRVASARSKRRVFLLPAFERQHDASDDKSTRDGGQDANAGATNAESRERAAMSQARWTTRAYVLTLRNMRDALVKSRSLSSVDVICSTSSDVPLGYRAYLGRFFLGPLVANDRLHRPTAHNLSSVRAADVVCYRCKENDTRTRVSFTLRWKEEEERPPSHPVVAGSEQEKDIGGSFPRATKFVDIFVRRASSYQWIGRSFSRGIYRVHGLALRPLEADGVVAASKQSTFGVLHLRLVATGSHDPVPREFADASGDACADVRVVLTSGGS